MCWKNFTAVVDHVNACVKQNRLALRSNNDITILEEEEEEDEKEEEKEKGEEEVFI